MSGWPLESSALCGWLWLVGVDVVGGARWRRCCYRRTPAWTWQTVMAARRCIALPAKATRL